MKAVIFGANGQDGYYLHQLCLCKDIEPTHVSRTGNGIQSDVSNFGQVEQIIRDNRPDYVFHMAANSTTHHDALFENHETISTGSINILEAVRRHCGDARVFITGSGVQFKNTGEPISEFDEFEPNSAYSVARIQSVYTARYYRSLGVRVYVGYLFHHESPLRKQNHVSKIITSATKRIADGSDEVIELGDLEVKKEWLYAGDVAKAIFTLVEQEGIFETTIGSGVAYSIKDWLDQCFEIIGKDWRDFVILREKYTPEYRCLVSNPTTIFNLGWAPTVSFPELAKMMLQSKDANIATY